MKRKILIISVCLVYSLFCLQQKVFASCAVPTIALASSGPTIDGNIDALWANAPIQSIAVTTIGPAITSPAGQWRGMYDATNFYFLIEVTDPQPIVNGTWNGDAIELCLQGGAQYQIGFPYTSNAAVAGKYGGYTGATTFMKNVAGGYVLELSFPKAAVGLGALTTGGNLKMEVCVNQTNNSGGTTRVAQLAWNNPSNSHWNSSAGYTFVPLADCSTTIPVTGVSVNPTSATIGVGYGIDLTETVYPLNASNKAVTWTSSNPAIATVSATGVVTGVSIGGPVTITATTTDGNFTATSAITVTAAPPATCSSPHIITAGLTPPVVDNVIETVWATAPGKSINVAMSGTPTNNPAGQWRALHDNNNLYLLIEVTDANRTANGSWDGDAVEIYIDGLHNGGSANYADADDSNYGYSYSPTTPVGYNGASSTSYKMHDVAGGYVLEVAIPWSNIGVSEATAVSSGISLDVVINQANGGARVGQVASFINNSNLYNTPSLLGSNALVALDCFKIALTGSNNGQRICIGDPVTLTATHSLTGVNYTWYKRENGSSTWTLIQTNTSSTLAVLPATSTEYKVEYAGESSNFYNVSAAICCSDQVAPVILYKEDFGILPANCARKTSTLVPTDVMQYADLEPSQYINDGYYAVVANPGCAVHGWNGGAGIPWFLNGQDHTPADTDGGMLMVNNGSTAATVFRASIKNPCTNTIIDFSAWFANACRTSGDCGLPVNLTFKVYGKKLGTWGEIPNSTLTTGNLGYISPLTWYERGTTFSSQDYDSLRVEIVNNGDPGQGNDALIDDITFTACAPIVNLYTEPTDYRVDTLLCNDGIITLTPISANDLSEFFTPLYYLLQTSTDSIHWINILPLSGNVAPTWSVNTDTLTVDKTYYRVIVGNNATTVLSIADSTYVPGACMLYTMTNVAFIAKPAFAIGTDTTITVCENTNLSLLGSTDGIEWQWENSTGGIIVPRSSNVANKLFNFTATKDSVFYFRAFDSNGCEKRQAFNIIVRPLPTYTFVPDDDICVGESVTLTLTMTGTPPFSFRFTDGVTPELITNYNSNIWTRVVTPPITTTYTVNNVSDAYCMSPD